MKSISIVKTFFFFMLSAWFTSSIGSNPPELKEEIVTYKGDGVTLKGFVVYNESIKEKRPVVLVVPEWWGLNEYPKSRARQLASLGYLAMAVDIFGNGKTVDNPTEAQQMTAPFFKNPESGRKRLDAAITKVKQYSQADPRNIAAIGYCFGGSVVLNSAKLGSPLKGVVSFHGILPGVPPKKDKVTARFLICHGEKDQFVSPADIEKFKHQMDSVGANYQFKTYPDGQHAFTNPEATKNGKRFNIPTEYNAQADENSWRDMKSFFNQLFRE